MVVENDHDHRATVDVIDENQITIASSAKVDVVDENESNETSNIKVDEVDKNKCGEASGTTTDVEQVTETPEQQLSAAPETAEQVVNVPDVTEPATQLD